MECQSEAHLVMPTVAIAGGTGRLGLTFAETLKDSPIYKVIVLARNVRSQSPVSGRER